MVYSMRDIVSVLLDREIQATISIRIAEPLVFKKALDQKIRSRGKLLLIFCEKA